MSIHVRAAVAATVFAVLGLVPVVHAVAAVNRWSTSGPGAGTVLALDVSPSDPNTVYAGAVTYPYRFGSGMYKSSDGGRTWDPIPLGLADRNVTEVRVAPSSPDIVYAGTYSRAVYRSSDGGAHWIHTNWPVTDTTSVMAMAVDPSDPDTVYASAEYTDEPYGAGLFKTIDGGESWTDLSIAVDYAYIYSLAIDPADPEVIYAGSGGGGVMKSFNGGSTWHRRNQGLGAPTINALQIDPQDPQTLYAGADDYYTPKESGVYKSTNAGHSWSLLDMTTFAEYRTVLDIAIDPLSPQTVYASSYGTGIHSPYGYGEGGGVFKSTDGGQTWAAAHRGLFDMFVWRLAIDPVEPSTLYAGTSVGVFKTVDGAGTWSSASDGLRAADAEAVVVAGTLVYAGAADAGVFRSMDGGVRWDPARDGMSGIDDVESLAADPLAAGTLYAGTGGVYTDGRGVFKTSDGGRTWVSVRNGLTNGTVRAIAVDGAGRVYAGSDDGVFESTDGGESWTQVLDPSPGFVIAAVAADPELPDVVYAVGWVGGVYKTSDGGSNWAEMDSGLGDETRQSLVVDPTDSQGLYLGNYCYNPGETCVYKSTDGGASWQPMDTGMKGTGVEALAVDPNAPSTVYAGTVDLGVYRSTDGGATWTSFNEGLRNNDVTSIAIDASGIVFAATAGSGVFVYVPG